MPLVMEMNVPRRFALLWLRLANNIALRSWAGASQSIESHQQLSLSLSQSIVKYFDLNTCRRGIRCANQVSSVIHAKWKWGEIRRDMFNYKWLVATLEGHEGGFFTTYNEVIIYWRLFDLIKLVVSCSCGGNRFIDELLSLLMLLEQFHVLVCFSGRLQYSIFLCKIWIDDIY